MYKRQEYSGNQTKAFKNNVALAAVDVGGRSVKSKIWLTPEDLNIQPNTPLKYKKKCNLAQDLTSEGVMSEASVNLALKALTNIRKQINNLKTEGFTVIINGVCTGPFRNASNGQNVLEQAQKETRLPLRIISGEEEAHYAAQGILRGHPLLRSKEFLGINAGGESCEIFHIHNGEMKQSHSMKLGMLRMLFENNAKQFALNETQKIKKSFENLDLPIALTGGIYGDISTKFSEIAEKNLNNSDKPYTVPVTDIIQFIRSEFLYASDLAKTESFTSKSIAKHIGIKTDRVPMLNNAALVLETLHTELGAQNVILGNTSIRDGMLVEMEQFLKGSPLLMPT